MKENKGSMTIEACISLTIFFMVFVTILYIMRIVFAYGIVQHALNQTAKEFSTYSYYYAISGLGDINGQINSSTAAGVDKFDNTINNVINVYDSFNTLAGSVTEASSSIAGGNISSAVNSIKSVSGSYSDFKNSLGTAAETIKSVATDPIGSIKAVGSVLLRSGNESAKTFLCGELARSFMAKYIEDGDYSDADRRLKNLRIIDGLDGINFGASEFWSPNSQNEILLVACYTIDPVFPFKFVDEVQMVNTVRVRGWGGKSLF